MKTRLIFAALLLLAFGTARAQEPKVTVSPNSDTIVIVMPDKAELDKLMQEYNTNLQRLYDSIDWERFDEEMRRANQEFQRAYDSIDWENVEKQMRRAEKEMEEWGRKLEKWGERFEQKYGGQYKSEPPRKGNAPIHAIQMTGSGGVSIRQSQDEFSLTRDNKSTSDYRVMDGMLMLSGSSNYEVVIQQLDEICMTGSSDVIGRGTLKGRSLNIDVWGSGDLWMNVDYDTIRVQMSGSGDVTLHGRCKVLYAEINGSGDLQAPQLNYDESYINTTGTGEVWANKSKMAVYQKYNRDKKYEKKSLLLNPHWNGFEAGLNLMPNMKMNTYTINSQGTVNLAIRPLASWYFGFNIADVGIAFNRKHTAGLFTGVGIGWNNFSWKPVYTEYDPQTGNVINTLLPDSVLIKNSNMGLLYLQVPLMVEIRPTRHMYIDLGVTGGLRFATWSKVKYADGKTLSLPMSDNPNINRFKLDASLRVGGRTFGFFINYAIVPLYKQYVMKNTRPLSFGLSINF